MYYIVLIKSNTVLTSSQVLDGSVVGPRPVEAPLVLRFVFEPERVRSVSRAIRKGIVRFVEKLRVYQAVLAQEVVRFSDFVVEKLPRVSVNENQVIKYV